MKTNIARGASGRGALVRGALAGGALAGGALAGGALARGATAVTRCAAAVLRGLDRLRWAVADLNKQQWRLANMRYSQDAYMSLPALGPGTYAEFLFRTRGPLRHEPSARARLDGHPVH
jgi:hypothetical protein